MRDLIKDLWRYLRERKKWWLAPVIGLLLLMGGLLIAAQLLTPFIYPLF
jgi:Family of unknown function (DUF5989)